MVEEEVQEVVLDEGCYYLSKLGLDDNAISERFEIGQTEVVKHRERYAERLIAGDRIENSVDLNFWRDVKQEAEGNVKVTFVTDKGFHHSWKSELQKLDGETLLSIHESCKNFLNTDPNARFLQYAPPKNYDPLAMQREINKAVGVIGSIMEEKWKARDKGSRNSS